MDAEQSRPRRLWQSFDELLGRGRAPASSDIEASTLHRFFDDKVAGVRASTAGADLPTFTTVPVGCQLRLFTPISSAEVVEVARQTVHERTASYMATEAIRRNFVSVPVPIEYLTGPYRTAPSRRRLSQLTLRRY